MTVQYSSQLGQREIKVVDQLQNALAMSIARIEIGFSLSFLSYPNLLLIFYILLPENTLFCLFMEKSMF